MFVSTATETKVNEETVLSKLVIPSLRLADRGLYTCTANNFIGNSSVSIAVNVSSFNSSFPLPPPSPTISADDNIFIDVRIAKQTVYGITLEWHAVTEHPAETWFTIHFGQYDSGKKEMIYIGPGINSYSVNNLLPVTKYEACVTLKNHAPMESQCLVFVTGNEISELEQRQRLIHIIVIVCAMVLAVPAGMYACTTQPKFNCASRCAGLWKKKHSRNVESPKGMERQGTFDSLQAASDEDLCRDSEEKPRKGKQTEIRRPGGSAAYMY